MTESLRLHHPRSYKDLLSIVSANRGFYTGQFDIKETEKKSNSSLERILC